MPKELIDQMLSALTPADVQKKIDDETAAFRERIRQLKALQRTLVAHADDSTPTD